MIKILAQIALGLWGILPGNYSGITHVKDNVYAIVDDKDAIDGFKFLTLDIDTISGKIRNATLTEPSAMQERRQKGVKTNRDCEGAAYFPEAKTIFVSGEEDQRIFEYDLNGFPTGRELAIPASMKRDKIASNLGFEALTYNARQARFWTTTEETLPADGDHASKDINVCNKLRFVSFDNSLSIVSSFVYQMDKPSASSKPSIWGRAHATRLDGVPSILALDDGRIIVMEREAMFPRKQYGSWVKIKLYIVNPSKERQVTLDKPMSEISPDCFMKKELLCEFTTHLRLGAMNLSNYEGMCLGPRLSDGRQTLILISDSQNGKGNALYHIKDHVRLITFRP